MNISKLKNQTMPVLVAIVISLLFVVASVHAATTISTDVLTGGNVNATGTLAVTGVTSLYGNVNINGFATTTAASGNFATQGTLTVVGAIAGSSTLQATGATTLYSTLTVSGNSSLAQASSSNQTLSGNLWVNGNATTTSAGAISAQSTLTVVGAIAGSSTLQVTDAARFYADSIMDGGIDALTLTHTDTATSSLTVGCIDIYATSTASPIRLAFTAFAGSTTFSGTSDGLVAWEFGSCS